MTKHVPSLAALRYVSECLQSRRVPCTAQGHFDYKRPKVVARRICQAIPLTRSYNTNGASLRQQVAEQEASTAEPSRRKIMVAASAIYRDFILDEAIESRFVRLRDEKTMKLVEEPQHLSSLLTRIDRDKEVVRQFSHKPGEIPIVAIMTKESLLERLTAEQQQQTDLKRSQRQSKPKQIELNWAIDSHDLGIKMRQMRNFLEQGRKVELLLASKRRARKVTLDEAQAIVDQIRSIVADIDGAREDKPMEGTVGAQAIMYLRQVKKT